ncbi:MAG: ABC transporter permease [Bacteroidales bacterium]|nr:ABC transporter permease [Bacteroidales bacterium]
MRRFFDIDRLTEIWEALSRNRSRSLLTGFGVFWGIFMLLSLMGGGQGLKTMLTGVLSGFATNSGFIIPGETSLPYKGFRSGRTWSLELSDIERLRREIPEIDVVTGSMGMWGSTVVFEDRESDCQGRGVMPEYARIEEPRMAYGRYINQVDIDQERKVCVLGKRIYKNLFPDGGDPCGLYVRMGDIWFQVVGVDMNNGNIGINGTADEALTIPMSVLQKLYNRGTSVDFICMTARPGYKIKDILAKSREILFREHFIDPSDKKAVFEINAEELFSIMDNLFKGVNLLIWLVGFGTLLAAAIGVSNIMMVTVKERTTEIGIRRAIGATPNMILSQVMMESMLLTLAFGFIGILLSVGFLSLGGIVASAASEMPVDFQVSFGAAMLAILILTVLGLLAGLAPAMRAMNIKPVDAMRDE